MSDLVDSASDEEMHDAGVEESSDEEEEENEAAAAGEHDRSKAPTNQEIQELNETAELFKSNVFKLQIDEMLAEVRINYKRAAPLETALRKIKSILDSNLEHEGYTLEEAVRRLARDGVKAPFPEPKPEPGVRYTFAWRRPAALHLVGSYAIKATVAARDGFNVDVAVEMPMNMFTDKDFLNNRYFHKRAHYLAEIAASLKRADDELAVDLSYAYVQNDPRRPILLLTGNGKGGDTDFSSLNCRVRIFPALAADQFPARKLAPGRNCVRPQAVGLDENAPAEATPRYNASLLADTLFKEHLAYLYGQAKACPGFVDACLLARVWLHQRGFGQGGRVFNGFLWSMLTAFLLAKGSDKVKLAAGFSSYQLFKGTMDFLATHDFTKKPVLMCATSAGEEFTVDDFTRSYEVVMVDPSGHLNLAAGMSLAELNELQHEARLAMSCFTNYNKDTFEPLFLQHVNDDRVRYDYVIRIPVSAVASDRPGIAVNRLDRVVRAERVACRISQLLREGLTNRVRLVTCGYHAPAPWKVGQEPTYLEVKKKTQLLVGLIVDRENASRLVDKGPSPEDDPAGAQRFRDLWGPKAELRRFKDGSIVESAVWQNDDRSLIVRDMALYLIEHHLGVTTDAGVNFVGTQLADLTRMSARTAATLALEKPVATTFQPIMLAFNQLAKQIKALEDLPLDVSSVLPAGAPLRYASLYPPQPREFSRWSRLPETARYLEPAEVVLQFERSGAWPDDLVAIQHMKSAFYLKLRECLNALRAGYRAVVAAAEHTNEVASVGFLDVFTPDGFVFRCRIQHTPEQSLLRREAEDVDTKPARRDACARALAVYQRIFTHAPAHSLQLQALCQQHVALSDTIRLTKRWFATHMLLGVQVPDEIVELICAHVFTNAEPWSAPGTGQTGFARVLCLLTTWNWKRDPLIVDTEGNMTAQQRDVIASAFQERRRRDAASDPKLLHAQMVIATEKDPEGTWWTAASHLGGVLAARIRSLAQASYACLDRTLTGDLDELKRLFVTPMADYDLLIHLEPAACPRRYERTAASASKKAHQHRSDRYKNLALSDADYSVDAVHVGFDPIQFYLRDLQDCFGNIALFFHDRYGGAVIGVVWKRPMLNAKPLKVNTGYSTQPSAQVAKAEVGANGEPFCAASRTHVFALQGKKKAPVQLVEPNLAGIASEMSRIGEGIVARIESVRATAA
ncbi:Nrap protein [Thamnocephalis sphaerospora]|uniref:U3 small nucleolar RNA-associated protein 22 n=1 Tax=Thamnocephalis sphaerospora TaxID=78915 RepID=A0A4P9XRP4_9FUNG|nr:Nrap protein [Thamnocephalis sphaerospora]|eukprot:RKP08622.1 Nrap protein [Thamnocephalis sphaerospora]